MSLITPDFGLLFWMTLIFGIVFFILAKFGFPVITDMVRKRQERIEQSLADAREIEARMASWKVEQAQMLEATRKEQSQMLREATETKARIVADAKAQAQAEADKILAELAADMRQNNGAVLQLHLEHGVRKLFGYDSFKFDNICF